MSKLVAFLALVCLVLTALWVSLLIAGMASAGPLETFEQAAAHTSRLHGLFYATYLNAALLTLAAVAFFAALYAWLKPTTPDWTVVGLVFVPIYGALNLVDYLSQVTLVPALVTLRLDPRYADAADMLLRLTLQAWPASTMAFFNGLAYAILGIPSILFGLLLWKYHGALRWGGLLLALNGAACILGVVGFLTANALLGQGVMIGGILFLLALFPISWAFLKEKP
ncbi:MAG: hypothetical protein QME21_09350 [Anaerolineales bacterium]|nr:hypothetical protein [Anaerolineales bacterium]